MPEPTFNDLSFQDCMSMVMIHVSAAEGLYQQMLSGPDTRVEMGEALAQAAVVLAQGAARATRDAVALSRASRHDFDPLQAEVDVDLMAAIAADVDAGLSDMGSDPQMDADRDAHCLRDVAAAEGDLLAPPPFDVEVPGSIWSETEALADRRDPDQYPFPVDIDPDEETPW